MVFSYRARKKRDGQVECGTLEAGSRAEAIALLGGRGLMPLSVVEGARPIRPPTAKASRFAWIALVGVALLLTLVAFWWWVWRGSADVPQATAAAKAKPAPRMEVSVPAAVAERTSPVATNTAIRIATPKTAFPKAADPAAAARERAHNPSFNDRVHVMMDGTVVTNHVGPPIFSNRVEQAMFAVSQPRGMALSPAILLAPYSDEEILEILKRPVEDQPGDDEATRRKRETVRAAKRAMLDYIAEGHTVSEAVATLDDVNRAARRKEIDDFLAERQRMIDEANGARSGAEKEEGK